jgi:hypothetical protein
MQDNNDKRLDIPSEANREKHINFMEAEERTGSGNTSDSDRFGHSDDDEKRRKEWQQGLEEGEKARRGEESNAS